MSETLVHIALAGHGVSVPAGGELRGDVIIENALESVRGVDVSLGWRTSGAGNVDRGSGARIRLAIPPAAGDGSVRIPFSLPVPLGPVTYSGQIVSVGWILRASVDIPWARDPACEMEIDVLPRDRNLVLEGGGYRTAAIVKPIRHELGPSAIAGSTRRNGGAFEPGQVLGALAFAAGSFYFAGWAGFVVAPIMAFVVAGQIKNGRRRDAAQRALGSPYLELDRSESHPGGTVVARAELAPNTNVTVRSITATLLCNEHAVEGSGSSAKSHNRNVCAYATDLQRAADEPGVALHIYEAALTLPLSAPPTFGAPDNDVVWAVDFCIDAVEAGRPSHKIKEQIVLSVQPV